MRRSLVLLLLLIAGRSEAGKPLTQFALEVTRGNFAGVEKIKLTFAENSANLQMNSNALNVAELTKIGRFNYRGADFYRDFAKIWDHVEGQTKNSQHSPISPHGIQLKVNGKIVDTGSTAYNKILQWLPKVIEKKEWNPIDAKYIGFVGVNLVIVETYEQGKMKSQKTFSPLLICQQAGPNVICPTSLGVVFVPEKFNNLPVSLAN